MYSVIGPYVRNIPLALAAAKLWALGIGRVHPPLERPGYSRSLMGLSIRNPIGLAAGLDRTGSLLKGTVRAGYGFTEVGSVTVRTLGMTVRNLSRARRQQTDLVVGVNIRSAPDKSEETVIANYITCLHELLPFADYIVLNLNVFISPEHSHRNSEWLERLLSAALNERDLFWQMCGKRIPLAIKFPLAAELSNVHRFLLQLCSEINLDGVVAVAPTALTEPHVCELIRGIKRIVGDVNIISVGGVGSADQVTARMEAGAAAVQVFSSVLKHGPYVSLRLLETLPTSTGTEVPA
jgi:dihydroorotate dehydrogenase